MDQRHHLTGSTLRELRLVVEAARDMPAESVVRVRTRFSGNGDGSLLRRVLIAGPEALPGPDDPETRDLFAPRPAD